LLDTLLIIALGISGRYCLLLLSLKGIVQQELTGVENKAPTMRTDKLSCRKYLLFQNKGTPSRKEHKTGFSVLTTIDLNLLDEFTKSCK
jgi:hypothetical protein